jgi:uncharacterized protein (DUF4415 family)
MKRKKLDDLDIPPLTDEDFKRARRVTPAEHKMFRKALENTFGKKFPSRMGRPRKTFGKYRSVTIRLHPYVLEWAQAEAKKRGVGYQTFINQTLLGHTA